MRKLIATCLCLCLCLAAFGGAAFAENASAETPAAQMTAEELYQAGKAAVDAEDYGKAMDYFQLAADAGNVEGWRGLGNLYANGAGVETDYNRAIEYYQRAAELGDAIALYNIGLFYKYFIK